MQPSLSEAHSLANARRRRAVFIALFAAAFVAVGASRSQADYRQADWEDCRSDDFDRVIAGCTRMLESQITQIDRAVALTNRSNAYRLHGDHDRAIGDANDAIRIYPDYVLAYANRANAYLGKGDTDNAMSDANATIHGAPTYPGGYSARADVYMAKEAFDLAVIDDTTAIALAPKYSGLWRWGPLATVYADRGRALEGKGDRDRALADYNEAIRLDPGYVRAYVRRADIFAAKGDRDHAIEDFSEAIRINPKFGYAYNARGIADYDQALNLDPKDPAAYFSRGIANLYGASPAKAVADFDQALALNPKDSYTALWRDIAAQRDHQPSRIADTLSAVDIKTWPAPLLRLYAAGQLTPEAANSTADEASLSAVTRRGRLCEINFYSAELALQKGAKDSALPLLKKAAADCPRDFVEYTGAKAELKLSGAE